MREIKFRGKTFKGEWAIGCPLLLNDDQAYIVTEDAPTQSIKGDFMILPGGIWRVATETVGQYTGLTDADGNEIYEGDIVEFTYWWCEGNEQESSLTGRIVYSAENMSFQLKGVQNKEWQEFTGYIDDFHYLTPFSELNFDEADFKIIGNKFDNPELLEEK